MTISDVSAPRAVLSHDVVHAGRIFDLVSDEVDLGRARVRREYIDHPGAVAVIVLDDADRVLLLKQYRHPVRRELWEPPAGLLDLPGESAQLAAARELAEEADLVAASWHVLVDYFTTPGGSNEALRVFLARGTSPVPEADRHVREDEEADISTRWVPLDEAVAAVLAGDVHNPSAVVGLLAAAVSKAGGWASLRPADAPWPERRG
ncbi:ADP-ribose pyrophosphatase [Sanguibacter gelidistatuariae]|uniref:ADP-ribose pyrophosphatase n=1 Tax=Sanguibacter gelidistatuariae TaxID=1814289 RepID=A0A1G6TTA1_9MICO|nr:NUDIX hydrolase [Sanguibacter gelidistatuariae]SDD32333.1 ADP-ribose pyrophosphatase [Sanguibacter gelidistatuariae]